MPTVVQWTCPRILWHFSHRKMGVCVPFSWPWLVYEFFNKMQQKWYCPNSKYIPLACPVGFTSYILPELWLPDITCSDEAKPCVESLEDMTPHGERERGWGALRLGCISDKPSSEESQRWVKQLSPPRIPDLKIMTQIKWWLYTLSFGVVCYTAIGIWNIQI